MVSVVAHCPNEWYLGVAMLCISCPISLRELCAGDPGQSRDLPSEATTETAVWILWNVNNTYNNLRWELGFAETFGGYFLFARPG